VVLGVLVLALSASALPASAGVTRGTADLHATSRNPVVTSYTWVTYGRSGYTNATLRGTATGFSSGAVVRLYAQSFPFHAASAPIRSAVLTDKDGSSSYAFAVTPAVATRYRVRVFSSSTATKSEASSALLVVYAATNGVGSSSNGCTGAKCTLSVHLTYVVPKSAIAVERRKHQYVYLDLPKAPNGVQPGPTTYQLVKARLSAPSVKGHDIRFSIRISYAKPAYSYWYYWEVCDRDSVGRDGLGLPGRHGCGNRTLAASSTYVG
jgi:hypothetical protein